jgi:hypothetical protein
MVLDYSVFNPPKIIKQEQNQEKKYKYKEPCTFCGTAYEVGMVSLMIIGLPLIGVFYALDFCFYESFGGRPRSCFRRKK